MSAFKYMVDRNLNAIYPSGAPVVNTTCNH